jgi:cysteine synthase
MIQAAEAAGRLQPGATLVEATSGNTGISLGHDRCGPGLSLRARHAED